MFNHFKSSSSSEITKEFYNYIDYFTPNETEAEFYTGIKITNEKEAKQATGKLINLGIKKIIITLEKKGYFILMEKRKFT